MLNIEGISARSMFGNNSCKNVIIVVLTTLVIICIGLIIGLSLIEKPVENQSDEKSPFIKITYETDNGTQSKEIKFFREPEFWYYNINETIDFCRNKSLDLWTAKVGSDEWNVTLGHLRNNHNYNGDRTTWWLNGIPDNLNIEDLTPLKTNGYFADIHETNQTSDYLLVFMDPNGNCVIMDNNDPENKWKFIKCNLDPFYIVCSKN